MTSGIYLITCSPPGRLPYYYVGQSVNVARRLTDHRGALRHGRSHNKRLTLCWNRHGAGSFKFEMLEQCSVDRLNDCEAWWLGQLVGHHRVLNFALEPGGYFNRGRSFSDEHKRKISVAHIGKPKGALTADTRKKMSSARLGRKKPTGFGAALSARQSGAANHMFGRRGAEHPNAREVVGVRATDGHTVRLKSLVDGKKQGFSPAKICECCKGARSTHKGFSWSYAKPS